MPTPLNPQIIRGTVYSIVTNGRSEVRVTIDTSASGGQTQDIYIGGSTQLEKGLTLFIKNLNTGELYPIPVITSSTTGKYLLECRNFKEGFENGHIIQIVASNVVDSLHDSEEGDLQREHELIDARRRILVDRDGNEHDADNPIHVNITTETLDFLNAKKVLTKEGPNGRLSQKDWYYKGRHWRQTITYDDTVTTHEAIIEVT